MPMAATRRAEAMGKQKIAVIGGGLMGVGIAQTFAAADHQVCVQEPVAAVRETFDTRLRAGLRQLGQDEAAAEQVSVYETLREAVFLCKMPFCAAFINKGSTSWSALAAASASLFSSASSTRRT